MIFVRLLRTAPVIAVIVLTAWLYVRLTAPECTVDQALIVGIVWLLLDIGAEIAITTYLGRRWSDLIGSPASPALRDLLLFTWIGAPAMFFEEPPSRPRSRRGRR